jgi:hypothetical protein
MTKQRFFYSELSEQSKTVARSWWINSELINSSLQQDHNKSLESAIKAITNLSLVEAIAQSINMKLTGYLADQYLSDFIEEFGISENNQGFVDDLRNYYKNKWEEELSYRINDIEFIGEQLASLGSIFSVHGDQCNG